MLTYSLIDKEVQYVPGKHIALRRYFERLHRGIEKFVEEFTHTDETHSFENNDYNPEMYQVFFELELSLIDDCILREVYLYPLRRSFREKVLGSFTHLASKPKHLYKIVFQPKINGPHKICLIFNKWKQERGRMVQKEYHLGDTVFVPFDYRLQSFNPTRINGLSYKMDTAIAMNDKNTLIYGLDMTGGLIIAVTCWGQKFIVSREFPQPCSLCFTVDKFLIVINSSSICKIKLFQNGTQGKLLKVVRSQECLPNYTDVAVSQLDKNIYVTQFNKLSIKVYSPNLEVLKRITVDPNFGHYRFPSAITIDPLGQLYIIAQNNAYKCHVFKCDPNGLFICQFKRNSDFNPHAIAYNPIDNNVYTVSGDDEGIAIFNNEGKLVRVWEMVLRTWERGTKKVIENPMGVAVNSNGVSFASNKGKVVMYHYHIPNFIGWEEGEENIPRWTMPAVMDDSSQKDNETEELENFIKEEEEEDIKETESSPLINGQ